MGFAAIIPAPEYSEKGFTYTDQTGRFLFKSSRETEYIMLQYNYDANSFLVQAIADKQADTLVKAWENLHNRLMANGHTAKLYILNNECSADVKFAMNKVQVQYQLVPPGQHSRNVAERAIRAFKDHFYRS